MANNQENLVLFEDARVVFANFRGEERQYNREGDRNFCILLEPDVAQAMANDGWNIKTTKEREIDGENVGGEPYLQVTIGYKFKPPRVVMIGNVSGSRTELGEDLIALLDDADVAKYDLMVRPYDWVIQEGTPHEKRGRKAYLANMYVTIVENYLDLKYAGALED